MKYTLVLIAVGIGLAGASCSSVYYNTMEKFGYAKRDLLVERVNDTRNAQSAAKQQFASALEHFLAVTKIDGGELQRKYEDLNREYTRSVTSAKEVRERIAAVESVAEALFREWQAELLQYTNPSLRTESQRQLDATSRKYKSLVQLMRRSADRMDPILATFHDQVLFLKHNLNARAIASLDNTSRTLEADISQLIAEMDASIRESEAFIKSMRSE